MILATDVGSPARSRRSVKGAAFGAATKRVDAARGEIRARLQRVGGASALVREIQDQATVRCGPSELK